MLTLEIFGLYIVGRFSILLTSTEASTVTASLKLSAPSTAPTLGTTYVRQSLIPKPSEFFFCKPSLLVCQLAFCTREVILQKRVV